MSQQNTFEGIHNAGRQRQVAARAFRPDGGAAYTATVPGGLGFTYIRLEGAISVSYARDLVGLATPADDNAKIWVEPGKDGIWDITARRYAG